MKIAKLLRPSAVEEAHLRRAGFTVEQIVRLSELRGSYPLLEAIESRRQLQWLTFIKWCYSTGRIHA